MTCGWGCETDAARIASDLAVVSSEMECCVAARTKSARISLEFGGPMAAANLTCSWSHARVAVPAVVIVVKEDYTWICGT